MAFFGLLLIILGGSLALVGVFTSGSDSEHGMVKAEILGFNVSHPTLFILGLVAASLIWIGLWFVKYGAQRGMKRRKENKRLNELHDKLQEADRAEARNTNGIDQP